MRILRDSHNPGFPERRVGQLVAQLRNHVLWDSLLIFSPPLLAAIGLAVYLYQTGWIEPTSFLLVSGAAIGVGLLAITVRTRPLMPSKGFAAGLLDSKTTAQDRFLTLATIDTTHWPAALVGRLRAEAAALSERIDLRRDFPYRIKRSFYGSLLTSLLTIALFYLTIALMGSNPGQAAPYDKIGEIADKMAGQSALLPLARELRTLAMKLQQPDLAEREKEGLIQQALDQIEKQQKKAQEKESLNVLGEASSTLKGLDQPSGGNQQENSETGGGAAQKNLSQEGQGEGKQSQGRGDDSKGQFNAERNKDMRQGQGLKSEAKEKGKETNPEGRRDGRDNKTQPDTADKDTGKELTGKTRGASQEKLGSSRSEEAPQGAPPAERYYKPGEQGQEGVKGAQYITVKLPEDLIANSPGEGTTTNQSKDARSHPKAPLSNVPLPAHVPDAPTEKQQLPLEYRGILR